MEATSWRRASCDRMSLWVVAELLAGAGAGAEYYTPRVFMFGAWASIRFIWMLYRGRDDFFFYFLDAFS